MGRLFKDPFCGSSTFLTRAFHRKIDTGEDVDNAFKSIRL
jgi:23S rRNA G2445 N2-methylase RlmL